MYFISLKIELIFTCSIHSFLVYTLFPNRIELILYSLRLALLTFSEKEKKTAI